MNGKFIEWTEYEAIYDNRIVQPLIDEIHQSLIKSIQTEVENEINERIIKLRYNISSPLEWAEFAKERLTLLQFGPVKRELWIDYGKESQLCVCSWNHNFDIKFDLESESKTVKINYNVPE